MLGGPRNGIMTRARYIGGAWMQDPRERLSGQAIFESLRRWVPQTLTGQVTLEETICAMDVAGVQVGLISAWWGPQGALIDNDEVAGFVRRYPDRLVGVASV